MWIITIVSVLSLLLLHFEFVDTRLLELSFFDMFPTSSQEI